MIGNDFIEFAPFSLDFMGEEAGGFFDFDFDDKQRRKQLTCPAEIYVLLSKISLHPSN